MSEITTPIKVILATSAGYNPALVGRHVGDLLESIAFAPTNASTVLVKPNFLRAETKGCICTNAVVIAAACAYLRDHGCRTIIGDSPGFGTAAGVARSIGLPEALAQVACADTPIVSLDKPVSRQLSCGGTVGISRYALEADHILNLPKFKAHSQMRISAAVKNLFGCVSGIRKAILHALHGDAEKNGVQIFPSVAIDIMNHLPKGAALLDGITAMHVTGPSSGRPYMARILAASVSPVALDTSLYTMLGMKPEDIPLWRETQRRGLPGAFFETITVSGEAMSSFDFSSFMLPQTLLPQTFNPLRLAVSTCRRLWAKLRS